MIQVNLGVLLARQGDDAGACAAFQAAIDSGPVMQFQMPNSSLVSTPPQGTCRPAWSPAGVLQLRSTPR